MKKHILRLMVGISAVSIFGVYLKAIFDGLSGIFWATVVVSINGIIGYPVGVLILKKLGVEE